MECAPSAHDASGDAAIASTLRGGSQCAPPGVRLNLNADKIDGIDSTNLASRAVVGFNLVGGGVSAAISLPADRAVHVAGAVNTDLSAGQLTVFRVPAGPLGVLIWTGTSWIGGTSAAWGVAARLQDSSWSTWHRMLRSKLRVPLPFGSIISVPVNGPAM